MQTLKNTAESLFLGFSDEPFKLSIDYVDCEGDFQFRAFDSVSDDDKEWSAFKRIYGKCRVTMLEIDFRKHSNGKNRITLHLYMNDTTKLRAISEETDDETD